MINYIIEKGGSPSNERNDCTVRALAIATETSYAKAYMKLATAGRKRNCGFHICSILKANTVHFNHTFSKLRFRKAITLQKFIKLYPTGTYYVQKYGHVFVIRDGAVLDAYRPGAYTRIAKAWKVTKLPNI
jgi:hypothetical protein